MVEYLHMIYKSAPYQIPSSVAAWLAACCPRTSRTRPPGRGIDRPTMCEDKAPYRLEAGKRCLGGS